MTGHDTHHSEHDDTADAVTMPRPTVAPMILALGITLLAFGVVAGVAFLVVGAVLLVIGIGGWVGQLLPGVGHVAEPRVPEGLPAPIVPRQGRVAALRSGMPGYRLRLPVEVQPISAGVKGGIAGGLVMPIPALIYAVLSGHGIWYPLNLLAGMMLPGVGEMTRESLEQFHFSLFLIGVTIHAAMSLVLGLIYGVLLPTLPAIPQALAWGGLLAPLVWSAVTYFSMENVNPILNDGVSWPWFVVSQFIFGITLALIVKDAARPLLAGLMGGWIGGLLMPIPAVLWSMLTGHGVWYPVNLLAALIMPGMEDTTHEALESFRLDWLLAGLAIHLMMSGLFGLLLGLLLRRLPAIPSQLAWGGLLMPVLWTALSFGMMGIVNPVLQEHVDWTWFVASQFVFGAAAAMVVMLSEKVAIPPAGPGMPEEPTVAATGNADGTPDNEGAP